MDELKSESMFSELHGEIGASGYMGAQRRLADYRAQVALERQELLDQLKVASETATASSDAHDKECAALRAEVDGLVKDSEESKAQLDLETKAHEATKSQLTDLQKKLEQLTPAHA